MTILLDYVDLSVCSIKVFGNFAGLCLSRQIHLSEHFCDKSSTKVFG